MLGNALLDDLLAIADKSASDTGTGSYRALGLKFLDYVIKDISNRQVNYHWRFLEKLNKTFSTAVDDFDYAIATIATDIDTAKREFIHIYDRTNDRTLHYVPYERFRRFIPDETNSKGSSPTVWSLWADQLLIYPVPDAIFSLSMDYILKMADATDDTTAILIPDKYKTVVMDGMLTWAFKFDPELGNAANQQLVYEAGIDRMIRDNAEIIAENETPISQRMKHFINHDVDRKNSFFFPLAGTNF